MVWDEADQEGWERVRMKWGKNVYEMVCGWSKRKGGEREETKDNTLAAVKEIILSSSETKPTDSYCYTLYKQPHSDILISRKRKVSILLLFRHTF